MEEITDINYAEQIASDMVVVDFWAEWCAPCKIVGPILDEISKEMTDVHFKKLNIDQNQQVAQSLQITAIPTIIFYKDGEIIDKIVGLLPKKQIIKRLEKNFEKN